MNPWPKHPGIHEINAWVWLQEEPGNAAGGEYAMTLSPWRNTRGWEKPTSE